MSVLGGLIGTWPGRALIGAVAAVVIGTPLIVGRITAAPVAAEVRTATVARGSVTQAVSVSGSVNAGGTVRMNFQTSGRVAEILVKVGDRVTAGQVLARLDTTNLEGALAQAQANLASAQARYDQTAAGTAGEDVASARLVVENAQRSLDTARRTAESDVATAKQNLAKLTGTYTTARTNFSSLATRARLDAEGFGLSIPDLQRQHADILAMAYALPNSAESRSAQSALAGATAPLTTAANAATTLLQDATSEYLAATAALVASLSGFDVALAAGADTNGPIGSYQSTLIAYQSSTSRLSSAIEVVSGQLSGVPGNINSALAAVNGPSTSGNTSYDSLRQGLRFLTDRVIAVQQPAASSKSRLTQAGSTLATVTDAVTSGLVNATQAITTAQDKGANSIASAESSLASAQASFAKTVTGPKPADLASAYASISSAQVAVETAQNNLANATLRAPVPGVVATLTGQAGESSSGTATNPFLSIANITSLQLHGTVGEGDVAKLRLGQVATVTVDAVGTATRMTGKVTLIDPVATIQQGVPVYGVDVAVDVPDAAVRPGMSGTANVILASRTNVLTVPNLAIRTTGGRRGVQVMREGKAVDAQVVLGIATDTVTEVVSGLEEGELVVLPAARATASGQPQQRQGVPGGGVQLR